MYEVYLDGRILYYPGDEKYMLVDDPQVKLSLENSGTCEFCVPPNNPEYENIINKVSMIQVMKDGKEIFCGQVYASERDYYRIKTVKAKGELAFLFDSIQPQAEYHNLTPRQMLDAWLGIHNKDVEGKGTVDKTFQTGIVTVTDSNDSLYRYTNRENTLDAIREKLAGRLGGYLKVRKKDGVRYLDWLTIGDYGKISKQPMEFGLNILDFSQNTTAEDIATACIPLGARLEESAIEGLDSYTDITSVNGGKDYICIEDAVKQYGWNCKVVKWDDVTVPGNLLAKAQEWLTEAQWESMTLSLKAIDLSLISDEWESWDVGDRIQVKAESYGLNITLPLSERTYHILQPDKDEITLGNTVKTFTEQSKSSSASVKAEIARVHERANFLQNSIDNATQMMTGGKHGYKVTEYDENGNWLRDLYMDAPDKETAQHVIQINMNGIGFSTTGYNGPYETAWLINGVLLGKFIDAGSITAEKLSAEYHSSVEKKIEMAQQGAEEFTGEQLKNYYAKMEVETMISNSAEDVEIKAQQTAKEYTDEKLKGYVDSASLRVTVDEISLAVTKKVGTDEIISKINQSAEKVAISAEKINLHGTVTANENFKVLTDGSIEAKNGKFTGEITGSKIQTAESGDRIMMDSSSTLRGYRNNTLYNILDMLSSGDDAQMTIDAKSQLTIRTPTLAVLNKSLGTSGGTAKVTKTGTTSVVTYVEKDKSGCKELWIYDNNGSKVVYCTLPVYLSVRYTSLQTMLGMMLTGGSTSTEKV